MSVNVAWKYWAKISTDHTKTPYDYGNYAMPLVWTGDAATSNFPILMMTVNSYMSARPDGGDIRFTNDAEGLDEIPFDLVNFSASTDPRNSRAEIWARVPSLSTVIDTSIYMWWGNSSATAYESSATYGRYNAINGWEMIYHGNGSGDMQNTRSTLHTLTNYGTTEVDGVIGKARNFNGINNYLSMALTSGTPNFASNIAIMGWVNWTEFMINDSVILDFGSSALIDDIWFGHQYINNTAFHLYNNGVFSGMEVSGGWGTSGTWKHFVAKYTSSPAVMRTYLNGVEIGTAVSAASPMIQNIDRPNSNIGLSNWLADGYFSGKIDELRITTGNLTSDYAAISYAAQSSPHTFSRITEMIDIQNWHLKQLRNELGNSMLQTRC
jgi:hypothetical protein